MLHNFTLGQYYPETSLIHRLDPRTKFLTLLLLLCAVTVNQKPVILAGQFVILGVLIRLSRVPIVLYIRQLKPFIWLLGITIILHAFLREGTEVVNIPVINLTMTYEGIHLGIFFGLRLFVLIALSIILMFTTAPTDMADGFEKLLRPLNRFGLSTHQYALMLGISFRFIPILFDEADRIQKAQIARGADFSGNLVSRIKNTASVVIPLFISVFHRANALALALEARGFSNNRQRTYFRDLRFKRADWFSFICVIAITTCSILV